MKSITKKTKIVATIGPASSSKSTLKKMIRAGLNVARLNFSHGTHESHGEVYAAIQKASEEVRTPVAILQDLSGPKIRIGTFDDGQVMLKRGQTFTLMTKKIQGDAMRVYVNYAKLPREVSRGATLMMYDGKIQLEVVKTTNDSVVCKVIVGGVVSNNKGVNVPGGNLSIRSLTKKDRADVVFGIQNNVAFIALSFVRTARDVQDLRKILDAQSSEAMIIAKVETQEAIQNIDEIIEAADGIMVARGDLAVEIGAEYVPAEQKRIIQQCNQLGKPVITATQMLDSMEVSSIPTRAEVSDVANAILDGTDAVMLSGETATGAYPVESLRVMTRIAHTTEADYRNMNLEYLGTSKYIDDTVTSSVVRVANNVRATAIVALTTSGRTARLISRFKPYHIIYAITHDSLRQQQLLLSFGVEPLLEKTSHTIDKLVTDVKSIIRTKKIARKNDRVVVSAGMPFGQKGSTNMLVVVDI